MKHLFLIRHAKSSWADDSLGDQERPLNNRGHKQLGPMGRAARAHGALDGAVYCSNATRALQTLEGLTTQAAGVDAHVAPVLYTFRYEVLLDWLSEQENQDCITLIGHNPALEELAGYLLKHPPENFPTCGFMHISLPIRHWHKLAKNKGCLEAFLTPKDVSYEQFNRKRRKIHPDHESSPERRIPDSLLHQYQRLRDLEPGVRQGYDHEFLHHYRIAIRRSRAVAESVADICGDADLRKAVKVLKKHVRATSHLRDLHVLQEDLAEWQQDVDLQAALASTGAQSYFAAMAETEHQKLCQRLRSRKYQGDMADWHKMITSRHLKKITRKLTTRDIRKALDKRITRYNATARQLGAQAPDEAFHSLRKQLKRIRYLAELDKASFRELLGSLKNHQQRFGNFQDRHVQIELLLAFRDSIATEPDMLVPVAGLNDLISRLTSEKDQVRDEILTIGGIDGYPVL